MPETDFLSGLPRSLSSGLARSRIAAILVLALAMLAAGCENPVRPTGDHLEAIDVRLRAPGGAEVARTTENRSWEGGPLVLTAGDTLEVNAVFVDFHGEEFTLYGREDFAVRMEFETPGPVGWEPLADRDRLHALAPGRTRMRVMIWHVAHPDFVSPWLEVAVAPPAAAARNRPPRSRGPEPVLRTGR